MFPWGMRRRRGCSSLDSAASNDDIVASAGPVIVEAYVNSQGAVYDYRIVSGPDDAWHSVAGGEHARAEPL